MNDQFIKSWKTPTPEIASVDNSKTLKKEVKQRKHVPTEVYMIITSLAMVIIFALMNYEITTMFIIYSVVTICIIIIGIIVERKL